MILKMKATRNSMLPLKKWQLRMLFLFLIACGSLFFFRSSSGKSSSEKTGEFATAENAEELRMFKKIMESEQDKDIVESFDSTFENKPAKGSTLEFTEPLRRVLISQIFSHYEIFSFIDVGVSERALF